MASCYRIRPGARADLNAIWTFIAQRNLPAADGLIDRLAETFKLIADFPTAGRSRNEFARNLRSFPSGDYMFFTLPHRTV